MGPGETAAPEVTQTAYALGRAIAQQGWVLLTGGRAAGVMDAASRGAQSADGLVVGILPDQTRSQMSSAVDIPILTDMGNGRNVINVLSSQVVIACGLGAGTLSEIALALKLRRPLVLIQVSPPLVESLRTLASSAIYPVVTVEEAIAQTAHILSELNQTHSPLT